MLLLLLVLVFFRHSYKFILKTDFNRYRFITWGPPVFVLCTLYSVLFLMDLVTTLKKYIMWMKIYTWFQGRSPQNWNRSTRWQQRLEKVAAEKKAYLILRFNFESIQSSTIQNSKSASILWVFSTLTNWIDKFLSHNLVHTVFFVAFFLLAMTQLPSLYTYR